MDKKKLASFILNGLKGINEITENIDFVKTDQQFIENQLTTEICSSFSNIKNNRDIEENFFNFLKNNEKKFQGIKIVILVPPEEENLKKHIDKYFENVHKKYNEDKMFYFYFQLILMEKFLKQFNKNLPRNDLKQTLRNILKNDCLRQKIVLSKCLGKMESNSVEVMSEFGNKIDQGCKMEREDLEKCVFRSFTKK